MYRLTWFGCASARILVRLCVPSLFFYWTEQGQIPCCVRRTTFEAPQRCAMLGTCAGHWMGGGVRAADDVDWRAI